MIEKNQEPRSRKCPYLDKNGKILHEGDKVVGRTNSDLVQAEIIYDEKGKDDYRRWKIRVEYEFKDYPKKKWIKCSPYTLYLAYHNDGEKCNCYEKINNYMAINL